MALFVVLVRVRLWFQYHIRVAVIFRKDVIIHYNHGIKFDKSMRNRSNQEESLKLDLGDSFAIKIEIKFEK